MATVNKSLAAANYLHTEGRLSEAEQICNQVLSIEPGNNTAWHLLGRIANDLQRHSDAAQYIQRSLQLFPQNPLGFLDLGLALQYQGKEEDAAACFHQALHLNPEFAVAHNNLGLVFERTGKIEEALVHYRRAIELRPDFPEAHYNVGNICQLQGNASEAIASYHAALQLRPNLAQAHNALGAALQVRGELTEAANCYARALELKPSLADAHVNRAQLSLLLGDFEHGWPEYEWRWKKWQTPAREFAQPRWDGSPLGGQTILIYFEQGLGDILHFIRYAPLVKERVGKVIFECPQTIVPLLRTCRGIDQFVSCGSELPDFDVQIPLLSLPGALKSSLQTIPRDIPYLFADPALVAKWREPLDGIGGFRIGINWYGRPGHDQSRQRDIPLEHFATLTQHPNVRLISLQKGPRPQHLSTSGQIPPLIDFTDTLDTSGAFTDTAAIMMNLDLVITSDTSIAHLAGALGRPVWVPLPFIPEWRWLLDRTDSPWYPTMRLFRQKCPGDWTSAFTEIESALRTQLGQ